MLGGLVNFLIYVYALLHPRARTFLRPTGFHIAFSDQPEALSVTWLSYFPLWHSTFRYRPLNCPLSNSTWTEQNPVARYTTGGFLTNSHVINYALAGALHSECEYEYTVGSGLIWSSLHTMQGRTLVPDSSLQTNTLVIGDMGSSSDSLLTRQLLLNFTAEMPIHAVLHSGDIAYNLKDARPSFVRRYFTEVESFAASVPYMVAPGNHEKYYNFTRYRQVFHMPGNQIHDASNLYYSFTLGLIHFIIYNAEFLFLDTPESEKTHQNWLISDLQAANSRRSETPWIVLIGHRPLYCSINWHLSLIERFGFQSNLDCSFRAEIVRRYMENIVNEAGVDMVISAHVHNYERFAPVYGNLTVESEVDTGNSHLNPNAPVYILNGAAGNVEENDSISPTPDPWRRYASSELGVGRLFAANGSHLYWEWWSAETQTQADYVWVVKNRLRYARKVG